MNYFGPGPFAPPPPVPVPLPPESEGGASLFKTDEDFFAILVLLFDEDADFVQLPIAIKHIKKAIAKRLKSFLFINKVFSNIIINKLKTNFMRTSSETTTSTTTDTTTASSGPGTGGSQGTGPHPKRTIEIVLLFIILVLVGYHTYIISQDHRILQTLQSNK